MARGHDRQLQALLLSPFTGQTLTTLICSENTPDLLALTKLIDSAPRAATLLALLCRFPAGPGLRCPNGRVLAAWVAAVRPEASAAAAAWRHTRGGDNIPGGRLRPGRRALVAVVRGDLGRCGRRRRGGLAEGG